MAMAIYNYSIVSTFRRESLNIEKHIISDYFRRLVDDCSAISNKMSFPQVHVQDYTLRTTKLPLKLRSHFSAKIRIVLGMP